ncbi:MAG: sigma-54-dependent Fis family transcriptional regulator [Motiliproteus sp.]
MAVTPNDKYFARNVGTTGNTSHNTPSIRSSWQRCENRYNLDPHHLKPPIRLTDGEIKQHHEPLEEFLIHTSPIFDKLRVIAKNSGYCILVTDSRGVVVQSHFDSTAVRELASEGLQHGSTWSESLTGTNGIGTCLATGKAITVYAEEHFEQSLKRFSCSASPLIGADGKPFGALDLSTFAQGNKLTQGLALNLVCETANQVEALLFIRAYSEYFLLEISPTVSPYGSTTTGILAIDEAGNIAAATTPALMLMGIQKRANVIGLSLEALTGVSLERVDAANGNPLLLKGIQSPIPLCLTLIGQQQKQARQKDITSPQVTPQIEMTDSPLIQIAGSEVNLKRKAAICHRVVDKDISILLQGETGTGKEVWAQAIHQSSTRCEKPFITLNCAAIPESLIESELFGYGSGTFTGGLKGGKIGKIQASEGGTLFLDEIGDMPLELQARLLRVLAEREITPLGQVKPVKIDLHVICATHRNLKDYVTQGEFREDLYYRVSGVNISLPALRDREDIKEIINTLLNELRMKEKIETPVTLTSQAMNLLQSYQWPGNIRQLKNALQYALCVRDGLEIEITDLPDELRLPQTPTDSRPSVPHRVASLASTPSSELSLENTEKDLVIQSLEDNRWIVTRTAKAMGISRSTLHRKIKKFGLLLPGEECVDE